MSLEDKEDTDNYFLFFLFSYAIIKQSQSTNCSISQLFKLWKVCFFPFPWKGSENLQTSSMKWSCWTVCFHTQVCVCCESRLEILLRLCENFSFSHILLVSKHSMWQFDSLSDNILFKICISVWRNIGWCWALYLFLNWVYRADLPKTNVHPHSIYRQNSVTL